MAALPDRYDEPVVELRRVSAEQLAPILDEETAAWHEDLDWDFHSSSDLVRRFELERGAAQESALTFSHHEFVILWMKQWFWAGVFPLLKSHTVIIEHGLVGI